MYSWFKIVPVLGLAVLAATTAKATIITADFGTGANVQSAFPLNAAGNNSSSGVVLSTPLLLDVGELQITATGGSLTCVLGMTAGRCANSLAYGLGVNGGAQDSRLDEGETIVLTRTNANYTVKLISFVLTGFNGNEQGQYSINGGSQVNFVPGGGPTYTVPGSPNITSNVTWSVPTGNGGNYTISQITLDITPNAVPEPATIGLIGLSLCGLGIAQRRKRSV